MRFEWVDPAAHGGHYGPQMGLIADEVESVFPAWVGRDPSGYKTLTIGGFEALTTEALRELRQEKNAEINSLQDGMANLRDEKDAQIAELEARLRAIEQLLKPVGAGQKGSVR